MRSAPPETAVGRFRANVQRLTGTSAAPLGIAVSGGADSLALLLLANAAFRGRCHAATVDHGLRAASADEAAFVASICHELAIPHRTLTLTERPSGNVSDWARRSRYAALETWADHTGLACYLTAHHADDQLETMLMRLNRGSGVAGLAGIRERQGRLVRPVLGWRRAELTAVVAVAGIKPVDDPASRDDRYDRARLRKALADADWLDPLAATTSAAALADAEIALEWIIDRLDSERIACRGEDVALEPAGLPDELVRRLVKRCFTRISSQADPRGKALSRLIATLQTSGTATLSGVRCQGGSRWRFAAAPPRRKN